MICIVLLVYSVFFNVHLGHAFVGELPALTNIDWTYIYEGGSTSWKIKYPQCAETASSAQSPINIETNNLTWSVIGDFQMMNYDSTADVEMQICNKQTAKIYIDKGDIEITGGGLIANYVVDHFHFHWGYTNDEGSEHTVDGFRFPLEMHIVHHNKLYSTLEEGANNTGGLAVLAVFFKLGGENKAYRKITDGLDAIKNPGSCVNIEAIPLKSLLPSDVTKFYRYTGSLTTPPCLETVIWTVFSDAIFISEDQLNKFRTLLSKEINPKTNTSIILGDNFRPIQKLNNRVVRINVVKSTNGTNRRFFTSIFIFIWIMIAFMLVSVQ